MRIIESTKDGAAIDVSSKEFQEFLEWKAEVAKARQPKSMRDHNLTADVESIWPKLAQFYLTLSAGNRSLSARMVERYRSIMQEGKWRLNGEAIVFDWDGRLLNGHHRLTGIIEAGVKVDIVVIRGVDPACFATYDSGLKRTLGHNMTIHGSRMGNVVAAMISIIICAQEQRALTGFEINNEDALLIYDQHPEDYENSAKLAKVAPHIMSGSIGPAMHYIFSRIDKNSADEFFADFVRGSGLDQYDPVHVLREKLMRVKEGPKSRVAAEDKIAYFINAWNARRQNRKLTVVKGCVYVRENNQGVPRPVYPIPV